MKLFTEGRRSRRGGEEGKRAKNAALGNSVAITVL